MSAFAETTPAKATPAMPPHLSAHDEDGVPLTGCWPLRRDFDIEHCNDAEKVLADMEFNDVSASLCPTETMFFVLTHLVRVVPRTTTRTK